MVRKMDLVREMWKRQSHGVTGLEITMMPHRLTDTQIKPFYCIYVTVTD